MTATTSAPPPPEEAEVEAEANIEEVNNAEVSNHVGFILHTSAGTIVL
jgi:hypothetical protein